MKSKIIALLLATLSIGSMVAIPGLSVLPRAAYALDVGGIVDDVLDQAGVNDDEEDDEDEAEEAAATEEDQSGNDNQDIDQEQTQSNEQDAEVDQEVTQSNSQDETNVQANELDTGDNTATVAQSNREDQDVDADADVEDSSSANAASEADAEDDDHIKAEKKSHVSESDETSAESQADAIIDATATATGIQGDQSNTATVTQNSSISNVDLSNNVAFGDDTNTQVAVPISDIDQEATNEAEQRAANLDLEETTTILQPTPTTTTQPPTTQPPAQTTLFCGVVVDPGNPERLVSFTVCATTLAGCTTQTTDLIAAGGGDLVLATPCRQVSSP